MTVSSFTNGPLGSLSNLESNSSTVTVWPPTDCRQQIVRARKRASERIASKDVQFRQISKRLEGNPLIVGLVE